MMDGGGWASYGNSLSMALATAVVGAALSFVTAYLVAKPQRWARTRQWLHAVATLPMAVPGLALGLGYILFFNAQGNPLHFLYGSMAILVLCSVAHFFSVAHITQLAALQQLDAEYERVADSLGVAFWTLLWRVHLPVCMPVVMQVAGYFFVNAMTTVSAVVFLYSPETTLASVAVLAMDDAGDTAPARRHGHADLCHGRCGPAADRGTGCLGAAAHAALAPALIPSLFSPSVFSP